MSLRIRHLQADARGPAAPTGRVWRTCLRDIVFLDADAPNAARTDLSGAEAYGLLLEIICGLRSPMVGETQVLGQFRAFLSSLPPGDRVAILGNQLIHDARAIREQFLRGLGSRTYGSEVRRRLDGCRVIAMIGAGALATELGPYLADRGLLHQWSRADLDTVSTRLTSREPAALVVAAPATDSAIARVARRYPALQRVVDLRAAEQRGPLDVAAPVVTLDDLFTAMQETAAVSTEQVSRARRAIRARAAAFESRPLIRPFGWDDLCA